jgi:hypothetical protein
MQNSTAQQQPTRVKLDLTIDELNVLIMGLVKLPYETSAGLVEIVRTQASQQLQQMQPAQGGAQPLSGGPAGNLQ